MHRWNDDHRQSDDDRMICGMNGGNGPWGVLETGWLLTNEGKDADQTNDPD